MLILRALLWEMLFAPWLMGAEGTFPVPGAGWGKSEGVPGSPGACAGDTDGLTAPKRIHGEGRHEDVKPCVASNVSCRGVFLCATHEVLGSAGWDPSARQPSAWGGCRAPEGWQGGNLGLESHLLALLVALGGPGGSCGWSQEPSEWLQQGLGSAARLLRASPSPNEHLP